MVNKKHLKRGMCTTYGRIVGTNFVCYIPSEDIFHKQETASLASCHVEDCEPEFLSKSVEDIFPKGIVKGMQILLVETDFMRDTRQTT